MKRIFQLAAVLWVLAAVSLAQLPKPSGGTGGTPSSSTGAWVLLEQHTASSSASLDFTSWYSSTYDTYKIVLTSVLPATDAAVLYMRLSTNGGSSYDSGANYYFGAFTWNTATGLGTLSGQTQICPVGNYGVSNAATGGGVSGEITLYDPANTAAYTIMRGSLFFSYSTGPLPTGAALFARYDVTTAVNAFQFSFSADEIASGVIRVYGIVK